MSRDPGFSRRMPDLDERYTRSGAAWLSTGDSDQNSIRSTTDSTQSPSHTYFQPPATARSLPYSVYSETQSRERRFDSTSSLRDQVYGVGNGAEFYESSDGINLLDHNSNRSKSNYIGGADETSAGINGDEGEDEDDVGTRRQHKRHKRHKSRKRKRKQKQWYQKVPWWTLTASAIQIIVFLAEFIRMGVLTGSPVQTKPSFNPMIGPSGYLMINMGGRFTPCMRKTSTDADTLWPCPNSTTVETNVCTLSELCGFSLNEDAPNQWWRFITAMFLHAGIIHLAFNMLLQIKLGGDLEKDIGIVRYFIIYWLSGIGGFIMSGNYAGRGTVTVGASGALFGIIAIDLLDLLFNWQLYNKPWMNLLFIILDVVISFVLGLLPGVDNFTHIGGFIIGILSGICLMRSPLLLRLKRPEDRRPHKEFDVVKLNMRKPLEHFKNRHSLWWLWWLVRLGCAAAAVTFYVVLLKNFENGVENCSWCKYLSCLPVHGWCDSGY